MSEVNEEENLKHVEAMAVPVPSEATENVAFQTTEVIDGDQQAPPSYDESASMPLAGGEIKGSLPPIEPVAAPPIPIDLPSIQTGSPPEVHVTTNPVIVMAPTAQAINPYVLGQYPVMVTCPNCHQAGQTVVEKKRGAGNWVGCGAMCLFGCWLGCQFIPFCLDDLKDSVHRCPHCNAVIGVRSAF